jgi:hypothetical protein
MALWTTLPDESTAMQMKYDTTKSMQIWEVISVDNDTFDKYHGHHTIIQVK